MSAFGGTKQLYKSIRTATDEIKNVFCVGRNYRNHAVELGNDVPATPMIFGKSTHAIAPAEGLITLPTARTNIHHELEIVLWMSDIPNPNDFRQSVGGIGLGLDLTDRDAQNRLKAAGHPWEFAKGFKNSAILTDFYVVEDWETLLSTPFSLRKNDHVVQEGIASDMIFSFQTLVSFVDEHFGLSKGDILFTGTPAGVSALQTGDRLDLHFHNDTWGTCQVK